MTDYTDTLSDCGDPVALKDAQLNGWFNVGSAELYRGFRITEQDTVLDTGCGDGALIAFCARFSSHILCVDIDEARLQRTRARLTASNITAVVGTADSLPISSNSISRLICTEVLEHIFQPAALLQELSRVGKPGALYLISVPDQRSEAFQRRIAPPQYFRRPNHINVFSHDQIYRLISSAGLEVLDQQSFSFYQSMWLTLFWACNCDLSHRSHPLLQSWDRTWALLMQTPQADSAIRALDAVLPKTRIILAKKPN